MACRDVAWRDAGMGDVDSGLEAASAVAAAAADSPDAGAAAGHPHRSSHIPVARRAPPATATTMTSAGSGESSAAPVRVPVIVGDLTRAHEKYIAHQCNCTTMHAKGTMSHFTAA